MNSTCATRTLLAILGSGATAALAHPGHGTGGASIGWVHFLTSPDHLLPVLVGLATLFVILRARRRTAK